MECAANQTALLVIDVQQGFFVKSIPIFRADELLTNINSLVDRAHALGVAVAFVQHGNKESLKEGSDEWRLHPALKPSDGDLFIQKCHGSAFEDTPLEGTLKERGIRTVVVAGLVTHGCVKATCMDGKKRGFEVVLVKDAHSSFNKDAERLITEWNEKLGAGTATLISAGELFLA